ncbi:hypothetical protein KY333_05745 [Candidatus Woesearchaeota archaeon]|nr:hypothetical protein [Candidatus Woesearchaeota archaeon]MBW2993786.1 hypothetical protein [Candidatus Woesearchaeota archaeon]
MKKTYFFAAIAVLMFLIGCTGGGEPIEITSPFIGGTTGVISGFVDMRTEVFDGGRDPFDIVIKLENKGEAAVAKENVRIKLSGINPAEFGKLEEDLTAMPQDDLAETRKDSQGNVIPGAPVFVEFRELNHITPITGGQINLPLRASMCYLYDTKAVSKICVRDNILSPAPGGICEINTDKPIFNSAGPIQFANFKESARSRDKIGFSFEVINAGTGEVYGLNTLCDTTERKNKNSVYVKVDSNLPGLSCTGLDTSGRVAEGYTTLFNGKKIVTCTQTISTRTDFEQLITLEAQYDYEEFMQTSLTVKSSGDTAE